MSLTSMPITEAQGVEFINGIKDGSISGDAIMKYLKDFGDVATKEMKNVVETMKNIDMKDVESKLKKGMLDGLIDKFRAIPGVDDRMLDEMTNVAKASADDAKDGLPDFKKLLLMVKGFEDMDKEV